MELSSQADILEVRADQVKDLDPDWLRSNFAGKLLYTLRSRQEGGRSEASDARRHRRLLDAASRFDLVDLEMRRDLSTEVLAAVEPDRRIISWHGPPSTLISLQAVLERMQLEAARFFKIVPGAEQSRQEIAPLALLHSAKRQDLIAFASGSIGTWTRLVSPRLGAPVVYGATSALPGAPGQLSVDQLRNDYGLPELPEVKEVCGVVGAGIAHSLSPRIHNNAYRLLDLPFLYLPFDVEAFGEFWLEVVESGAFAELGVSLRGFSVTAPHKRIAAAVGGAVSPLVDWLGSANTLVRRGEVWEAESTDGEGVIEALKSHIESLSGISAAVLGAGGAGRAAVAALQRQGAEVTLVNRGFERGKRAAKELRVPFRELEGFDPAGQKIVVHATSLGREPSDPLPVDPHRMSADGILVDLVYLPSGPTQLVQETRLAGRLAIDGREVLLLQAAPQFRMMTGHEMPVDRLRDVVGLP